MVFIQNVAITNKIETTPSVINRMRLSDFQLFEDNWLFAWFGLQVDGTEKLNSSGYEIDQLK